MKPQQIVDHNNEMLVWLADDVQRRAANAYADLANIYGIYMRCTETLRSTDRQTTLYNQGRKTPGAIVTWARPGSSWHEYGLAFDSCFAGYEPVIHGKVMAKNEEWGKIYTEYLDGSDPYLERLTKDNRIRSINLWNIFGAAVKKHGLTWGGDWGGAKCDRPHTQMTYSLNINDLKLLKEKHGLNGVFEVVDQCAAIWPNKDLGTPNQ